MKIENLPTNKLVPYARNAKTHPPAQVARIAGSIKEFGFCNPVLIDNDNGIIAGHGRVLAAQKLGMAEVPCIRLGHLTDAQRRAYILADNRLSESDGAGWDMEMLKLELEDLGELDVGLEGIGFGADDLADMDLDLGDGAGNGDADAEPQIDKAEELREKWGVETGQLWQLGDHRILCGDSTNADDVARVMGGEKCEAVLTDPPYGIGDLMHGGTWARKQDAQFEKMRRWDATTDQKFFEIVYGMGVPAIVWGGNYFSTPPSRCWLVWDKPEFPTMSSAELAWTNLDKNTKRIECPRAHQADGAKDHATQKPVAVIAWCLGFLPEGIIYDPFLGSGTTIIACEQLGRKCRAIEISPGYLAVAIQRWADATGKEPKLLK
jgi:hypothetical protein